ncbi:hypothetical protein V1264_011860 [Littorina saxatilis]|uniref:Uncharacterized protein n=2 Tax=Littorina saxatilis TaxID=31220 RepID=A0AAN9BW44_9CAEN
MLPAGRLLNSAMVSSGVCTGSGTIGFTTSTGQICNGAYGKNPTTGETVIYTLATCWAQSPTAGVIGDETIPFDSCSVTSATASPLYPTVTTLTLSPMASFFLDKMFEGCPNSDCLYNPFVMQNAIDWRKCYTASYGATTLGEMGGQLNMVPVSLADATQCFNLPAGSQCFKATSGTPCTTDNGAPLYCSLTTGETVLYGLTTVNNCLSGNTAFNVMPLFGATGTEITLP